MSDKKPLLGVLGGLGPMSTFYFCELLTAHTRASSDADHIDMIVSSRASTPDRTAWILGRSDQDPLPVMLEEAHRLERAGADLLVIPCNTAHFFYDGIAAGCRIPVLNIIRETVAHLCENGVRRFGLLATEGTVFSGAYRRVCEEYGVVCEVPTEAEQRIVSSVIYDEIKQNRPVHMEAFLSVADALLSRGSERLVLGCTELSLLKKRLPEGERYLDSLEALAFATIRACKKTPVGFPADFLQGRETGR